MRVLYRYIFLTKNGVCKVSPEDYDWVILRRWQLHKTGYATRTFTSAEKRAGVTGLCRMHRIVNGTPPGLHTDHINGSRLDNRRENLRTVTIKQNAANKTIQKKRGAGQTKYKGVCALRGRNLKNPYLAYIGNPANGTRRYLGYFATQESAARAYDTAARELFGEFARPNFPEGT